MAQKPRLLVTRRLPPNVTARVQRDYDAILNEADDKLDADAIIARIADAEAMLVAAGDRIDAGLIGRLPPRVKAIATFSVGHEHIDVAAAKARGIVVTNTPDVLTDATADIALLLLLAASRRAYEGERLVREGRWTGWHTTMLLGPGLAGKRLGIFGMGRIGRAVAARARPFGLEIHYYNRSRLIPDMEQGAIYHADPESLLRVSDFLSLNAPSGPETRDFLDARRIALLPDGAVVVNTARGDLVDDDALISALKSGKLFAAGLDVFKGEPRLDPRYAGLDNVFLLPHVGSATIETRDAMGFTALNNLDAIFAGRTPPNPV